MNDRTEAQRIHDGDRTCAHGEDIAQNAAHAGCGALERFDKRRVVVGFDLEGTSPAVADVDNAGILAWSLHHPAAMGWQTFQMHA